MLKKILRWLHLYQHLKLNKTLIVNDHDLISIEVSQSARGKKQSLAH